MSKRFTNDDIKIQLMRLEQSLGDGFEVAFQQGNGSMGVQSTLRITRAGDAGSGATYHMGGAKQSTWQWLATFNEGVYYALAKVAR